MNLHILKDEKFTDGAIEQFERYYPGQNIYLINKVGDHYKYVRSKNVIGVNLEKNRDVLQLIKFCNEKKIKNVFVHFLNYFSAGISNLIRKNTKDVQFYWIFFGGDLYNVLREKFQYPLHDISSTVAKQPSKKKIIHKFQQLHSVIRNKLNYLIIFRKNGYENYIDFIKHLDYFCFWNIKDYELMQKYFKSKAKFKYFYYCDAFQINITPTKTFEAAKILINNSASSVGNHMTILNKFKQLQILSCDNLVIPLNYGSPAVKSKVIDFVETENISKITIINDFLPKDEYFNLLSNISVAFFGARRQHGAGNVFQLLAYGTKVFLRNNNNMLSLLKEWGFLVFSYEDDFNSAQDLGQLSIEAKITNYNVFKKRFNYDSQREFMVNLINDK